MLNTIEDFMWAKLTLVAAGAPCGTQGQQQGLASALGSMGPSTSASMHLGGAGPTPYTLTDLQRDILRWPPTYYK